MLLTPKVSTILSVYNDENKVCKAIDSILNQSFKELELLVIDDCSTDNTYNKISSMYKNETKVKIFKNNKNLGLTKSLNILINKSSGQIIARQDSDDISKKYRIEKQLYFIEKLGYDACSTRAVSKQSKKNIPKISHILPTSIVMKFKNPYIHGSLMIKKSSLVDIGGYDERYLFAQDYKLMKDLIKFNKKIKIISEPLYVLNQKDNISNNFKAEQEFYAWCVKNNIDPSLK